jgi:hypothetical protein
MSIIAGFVGFISLLYGIYAVVLGDRMSAVDAFVVAALALAVCGATWRRPPATPPK